MALREHATKKGRPYAMFHYFLLFAHIQKRMYRAQTDALEH